MCHCGRGRLLRDGAHGYVRRNTRLTPADRRSHFETSVSSCLRPAFVSA